MAADGVRTGRLPVAAVGAPEPAVGDGGVRAGVVPESGTSADGVGSGTMGLWGLKDGEAPGESLGETGPVKQINKLISKYSSVCIDDLYFQRIYEYICTWSRNRCTTGRCKIKSNL